MFWIATTLIYGSHQYGPLQLLSNSKYRVDSEKSAN